MEYEFTLVTRESIGDDEAEALYEAGCDDALVGTADGEGFIDFVRVGNDFADALRGALEQVAAVGLHTTRIEPDDLVTMAEIAERTARTRESVRLLISGERGKGGFPPPVSHHGRTRLWRWNEVAAWLGDVRAQECAPIIAYLNSWLEQERLQARVSDRKGLRAAVRLLSA